MFFFALPCACTRMDAANSTVPAMVFVLMTVAAKAVRRITRGRRPKMASASITDVIAKTQPMVNCINLENHGFLGNAGRRAGGKILGR